MVAAAIGVGVAAAGIGSSMISSNAAGNAADTQAGASRASIAEQQREFNAVQELFKPYVNAGTGALSGQQDLLGLNGSAAQQNAINGIQGSPQFTAMTQQGENAILQNASATGGLRGGNTQSALAQFRPALLSSLIDQQYSRLGGLSQLGQASAAGQAVAGQNSTNAITALQGQQAAATAGGQLAQGQAWQQGLGAITSGLGAYTAAGGKF